MASILKTIVSRLLTTKTGITSKASIVLSADNGAEKIVFPIIPGDLPNIDIPQNNDKFTGILGDMSVIGTIGLRQVSIESFLPGDKKRYSFANPLGSEAAEFINFVNKYREQYIPVRLVIAYDDGSVYINMACLIDNFNYSIDNVKDYHYKLNLIEYRMVDPITGGIVS